MAARRISLAWLVASVALLAVTLGGPAGGARAAGNTVRVTAARATPAPRVLLLGDSVMDQQGGAAAFALRQAGVDAKRIAYWGSGLLTIDQYDYGHTTGSGFWLSRARDLIDTIQPDVVAVYLNHNYWPPHPHNAHGNVIDDLWSAAGQAMIHTQAETFIGILRSRGARVYFVRPVPMATSGPSDPRAINAIWAGYVPVLQALHVGVIDSSFPLASPTGNRVETKPDCHGDAALVRPPGDIHLTRLGAGLAGSALAAAIARTIGFDLHGNGAPGQSTAALVPTPDGLGYWLVGCDGSVFHFGSAPALPGVVASAYAHHGVVGAATTTDGNGLWMVTSDGSILTTGDASPMQLDGIARAPIAGVAATPDGHGLWATTVLGDVLAAGSARNYGSLSQLHLNAFIDRIRPTPSGHGYWLAAADGGVFSFGDARFYGSTGSLRLNRPIVAMTPTADGRGYWLLGADGGIFTFGDARYYGNALPRPLAFPLNFITPPDGPLVDVVATPGTGEGYWTVTDNGKVAHFGDAPALGGDANLALWTR